jgi:hypothetical protein
VPLSDNVHSKQCFTIHSVIMIDLVFYVMFFVCDVRCGEGRSA